MHISNVSHPLQTGPVEPGGTGGPGDLGTTGGPGDNRETGGRPGDRRAGGPDLFLRFWYHQK